MNFSKNEVNEIIEMYENEESIDSIMKHFSSDEHDIRMILKQYQVDREYNTFTNELYERIKCLYLSGYTQKKICYDLLISEVGIKNTLKRSGIEKRTQSESNQKYSRDSHYFDIIDTVNKAYILGLLYADGCNHRNHNSITICLQEDDVQILKDIKDDLRYEGPLRLDTSYSKNPNHKNQYVLCINDKHMSEQLEKLGVVNGKSLIINFPKFLDNDLISHFVRGYFDGDGCIYYDEKRSKCRTSICGTYDFCKHIVIEL